MDNQGDGDIDHDNNDKGDDGHGDVDGDNDDVALISMVMAEIMVMVVGDVGGDSDTECENTASHIKNSSNCRYSSDNVDGNDGPTSGDGGDGERW